MNASSFLQAAAFVCDNSAVYALIIEVSFMLDKV